MATKLNNKLATAEEQVREAYLNGATLREIAEVHGVSAGTVRNKLIEQGVDLRRRGRRRKEEGNAPKTLPVQELPQTEALDPTPIVEGD